MAQPPPQGVRDVPIGPPARRLRAVSVAEMQRIDREAIQRCGIPRLLLMEHAGLAVANAVQSLLPQATQDVLVCCGSGYNGGDGLCAARHLAQRGHQPRVVLAGSIEQLKDEPAIYARIVQTLGLPFQAVRSAEEVTRLKPWFARTDLIIDALLGIGLQGPVRPLPAQLIELMNQANKPIVSVDVPSGLDADTGAPQRLAVKATLTVTFGLPKRGLVRGQGPTYAGRVVVDEIGIPNSLLEAR